MKVAEIGEIHVCESDGAPIVLDLDPDESLMYP